jgi:predicted transposase YdaD
MRAYAALAEERYLKTAGQRRLVVQVRNLLLADENLAKLEPLLAFLSTFTLESEMVQRIMRWDMAVIRESPWAKEFYQEGIQEGLKEGRQRAAAEMVLHALNQRLGTVPPPIADAISNLTSEQNSRLFDIVLETESWTDIERFLANPPLVAAAASSN